MTNRERALAVLNYEPYDVLPVVHFGFWDETVEKWKNEGHIDAETAKNVSDGSENQTKIASMLGFDFGWGTCFCPDMDISPRFVREVVEQRPDGTRVVRNGYGVLELEKPGVVSIPAEVGHTLVDRASWEKEFLPRLQYSEARIDRAALAAVPPPEEREVPIGLGGMTLFGRIRDWMGVEGISYLYADDEELYKEIIDTFAGLQYRCVETALKSGTVFDYAHFWEDICFKNGPLVVPSVFDEFVGPHYKRITDLCHAHGISLVSLDCDGWIDALIPTWIHNGVNTMFPIEVGTWNASIAPWREQYGKELRGVGGMNKTVFAHDYAAIDKEIERLRPLVELGGYLPCPDHRIAPDAKWENVQYYCDKMHKVFG